MSETKIRSNLFTFLPIILIIAAAALAGCDNAKTCDQCINSTYLQITKLDTAGTASLKWKKLENYTSFNNFTRIKDTIYEGGETNYCLKPLEFIDARTFQVSLTDLFAKDTFHIFCYNGDLIKVECPDCDSEYGFYFNTNCIYFYRDKIIASRADSIIIPDIPLPFAFIGSHVYLFGDKLPDADPISFYHDEEDNRNFDSPFPHSNFLNNLSPNRYIRVYVFKDKSHTWLYTINHNHSRDGIKMTPN